MKKRSDLPVEVMTVEQVADYLQLNKLTVYKYVRDGRLPASKLGKSYRIRRPDVDWFLDRQKVPIARPVASSRTRRSAVPPRRAEELLVAPERPGEADVRDIDVGLRDPLVWMIRGLH